jgi:hypothetical protein
MSSRNARSASLLALLAAGCVVPWVEPLDTDGDTDVTSDDEPTDESTDEDELPNPRSPAKPLDTCQETAGFGTMKAGTFQGTFADLGAEGFVTDCGGGWSAPQGTDGYFRVILEPRQTVDISFTMPQRDVTVFMLNNCKPTGCESGADVGGSGATEGLSVTNFSADREEYIFGAAVYAAGQTGAAYEITVSYK